MLKHFLESLCSILRILLGILVGALIVPVIMQVVARYTGIIPVYLWTEELATFIFVWIIMIGSALAVWDGEHFDVQVLPESKTPRILFLQKALVHSLVGVFGLLFIWYGIDYVSFGYIQHSVMMNANQVITHITIPLAGLLWCVFSFYRLYENFKEYQLASVTPPITTQKVNS